MSTTDEPSASESTTEHQTVRDRVWNVTLDIVRERPEPFTVAEVRKRGGLDESCNRTIRRTLRGMVHAGWVDHADGSKWWYAGEKANECFRGE